MSEKKHYTQKVRDLILSRESLPAILRLAVALIVIVGGGTASCNYLFPKANLSWYVERSQPGGSSGVDPDLSLIAVNTGNAVVILPRTGILHYDGTGNTFGLVPRPRETADRALDPNESVTIMLNNSRNLKFDAPTACELHYKARYPPSGKLVDESYKFRCG